MKTIKKKTASGAVKTASKTVAKKNNKWWLLTSNEDWADEHDVPALACFTDSQLKEWKSSIPETHAYLGNGGDGFMEGFEGLTGEELIQEEVVEVTAVSKEFWKTFHKVDLSSLSLSNIFDC